MLSKNQSCFILTREIAYCNKFQCVIIVNTWDKEPSGSFEIVAHIAMTNNFGGCTRIEAMLEKVGHIAHVNLSLISWSRTAS